MRQSSALLLVSCVLLSGCAGAPVFSPSSSPTGSTKGISIAGKVHGGQSPIVGAKVYLYAVNVGGYAGPGEIATTSNQSISELNSPGYVTTASDGSFSITGDYTCSAATPDLYLLSVGGSPEGSGSSNSAIVLAAGLGPCTAAMTLKPFVFINEVSTVAAAYAAAGFATDPYHASSSGSTLAVRGVENALGTIANLVTQGTGVANSAPAVGTGVVPQATINTLANILAACVNSTGPTSSTCTTLFDNAESNGTPAPDTASAILNIAHNPGANVGNLFPLQAAAGAPFIPDLSAAPNDFTIGISYTGGGLSVPYDVAIDGKGNVWVINQGATVLSAFSPLGVAASSSGFTGGGLQKQAYALAIDSSNDAWVASNASGNTDSTLSEFNSSGSPVLTSGVTTGGIDTPRAMTIDKNGNIWVANRVSAGSSVSEYSSAGSPASGSPFSGGGIAYPWGIAADLSGNIWVPDRFTSSDASGDDLSEFTASTGDPNGSSPRTGGGLGQPVGVAVDASGNVWVTDQTNSNDIGTDEGAALSVFNSSGAAVTGTDGYTGGGMSEPTHIAIDGAGNIWVADYASSSICAFSSSGTAISGESGHGYGYGSGLLDQPWGLAIDPSGNLWVPGGSNSVVEIVGVAAPVVTPVAANLVAPYGSAAVNRP